MSQGRCSATIATLMVALCLLVLLPEDADAATYIVGGAKGWAFNTESWTNGKRFAAGDILVFNYNPSFHNVVAVNAAGFSKCRAPKVARVFQTGKDEIKLVKGRNYFICSFPGHCASGMRIAISV